MPMALLNFRYDTGIRSVGILVFLIASAFSSQLLAKQSIEQQRQLFRDASVALERNQITRFNRLLKQLGDYPAAPYLKYDAFKRSASRVKASQAETFFKHYAEFPFVYHARAKWLNVLAKRRDWENYLQFFDNRENTRLKCLAFQARLNLNQLKGLNDEIAKVWLRGYSQPSQCDPAFAYFLENYEQALSRIVAAIMVIFVFIFGYLLLSRIRYWMPGIYFRSKHPGHY